MNVTKWIKSANSLLDELAEIDIDYPIGENTIRLPKNKDIVNLYLSNIGYSNNKSLLNFYLACDGLSWPDVYNGYFINSIEKLNEKEQLQKEIPVKVTGIYEDSIIVFGSDGGGEYFAIRKNHDDILKLLIGPVHNGIYDGNSGKVRIIGETLSEFLERLLADLKAFVLNEDGHTYLS